MASCTFRHLLDRTGGQHLQGAFIAPQDTLEVSCCCNEPSKNRALYKFNCSVGIQVLVLERAECGIEGRVRKAGPRVCPCKGTKPVLFYCQSLSYQ